MVKLDLIIYDTCCAYVEVILQKAREKLITA